LAILEGIHITKYFGGLRALDDINFEIEKGQIMALIGPNGAGKTTLFNVISGFLTPTSGTVKFEGKEIKGKKPHSNCKLGIARTFQLVKSFGDMKVIDNVAAGKLFGREHFTNLAEARRESLKILEFVGLMEKANLLADSLTFADKRKLELARALGNNPKLLLLDEVMAGLNPKETVEAVDLIRKVREEWGITVFLIEHVMKAVMTVSDKIMVISYGEKISEGTPKEVANDHRVIEAYLGRGA